MTAARTAAANFQVVFILQFLPFLPVFSWRRLRTGLVGFIFAICHCSRPFYGGSLRQTVDGSLSAVPPRHTHGGQLFGIVLAVPSSTLRDKSDGRDASDASVYRPNSIDRPISDRLAGFNLVLLRRFTARLNRWRENRGDELESTQSAGRSS
jgi:hypothetical protein